MAGGEWVSVRSQVDLFRGLLTELRQLICRNRTLVLGELSSHLRAAGFGLVVASQASSQVPPDESAVVRLIARTVFGFNPDEPGSPNAAALASLLLFAIGAIVPLLPWFFTSGGTASASSVALTAMASLVVGGLIGRSGNRSLSRGALRQLFIVSTASAITYGIGLVVGAAIS